MRNYRQNSNGIIQKYKILLFALSIFMMVGFLYLAFVEVEVTPVLVEKEIKIDFTGAED